MLPTFVKATIIVSNSSEQFLGNYEEVTDLNIKGLWAIGWLVVVEYLLLAVQGKPLPPVQENVLSMIHAILNEVARILVRTFEYSAYIWLWRNYGYFGHRFSDSAASFLASVVLIDFGYYWFHRLSHEVMIFWAIHQVHHSSYDFTVSVSLRHSPLQNLFAWIFYLPLAVLGLSPERLVCHLQLNLFYQTWIHTCSIDNLGPLEWVFNTPSHHRVHHGSTKYCIDKNFGGVFIIWDRIFGTFEKERPDVRIVYGIVFPVDTWNPLRHQIMYLQHMLTISKEMITWKESIDTIWKGPSWKPGLDRLGRDGDISNISSYERTKVNASALVHSYVVLHLTASLILLTALSDLMDASIFAVTVYSLYVVAALTNIGIVYEGQQIVIRTEFWRCFIGAILSFTFPLADGFVQTSLQVLYVASFCFWLLPLHRRFPLHDIHKEDKKE